MISNNWLLFQHPSCVMMACPHNVDSNCTTSAQSTCSVGVIQTESLSCHCAGRTVPLHHSLELNLASPVEFCFARGAGWLMVTSMQRVKKWWCHSISPFSLECSAGHQFTQTAKKWWELWRMQQLCSHQCSKLTLKVSSKHVQPFKNPHFAFNSFLVSPDVFFIDGEREQQKSHFHIGWMDSKCPPLTKITKHLGWIILMTSSFPGLGNQLSTAALCWLHSFQLQSLVMSPKQFIDCIKCLSSQSVTSQFLAKLNCEQFLELQTTKKHPFLKQEKDKWQFQENLLSIFSFCVSKVKSLSLSKVFVLCLCLLNNSDDFTHWVSCCVSHIWIQWLAEQSHFLSSRVLPPPLPPLQQQHQSI